MLSVQFSNDPTHHLYEEEDDEEDDEEANEEVENEMERGDCHDDDGGGDDSPDDVMPAINERDRQSSKKRDRKKEEEARGTPSNNKSNNKRSTLRRIFSMSSSRGGGSSLGGPTTSSCYASGSCETASTMDVVDSLMYCNRGATSVTSTARQFDVNLEEEYDENDNNNDDDDDEAGAEECDDDREEGMNGFEDGRRRDKRGQLTDSTRKLLPSNRSTCSGQSHGNTSRTRSRKSSSSTNTVSRKSSSGTTSTAARHHQAAHPLYPHHHSHTQSQQSKTPLLQRTFSLVPERFDKCSRRGENAEEMALSVIETGLIGISIILLVLFFPLSLIVCLKVVAQYERAVIFRLGQLLKREASGPGLIFVLPCLDHVKLIDLRTFTFDVPTQEVLTRDSVTVAVNAVVYYRIFNPIMSVVNVEDANRSTRLLAQTTLRNVLGTVDLSALLQDRENIANSMQETLDIATDVWGMKVERVEVKDVRLPVELQRAMAAEAEAAREASAKVIAAKGEQKASKSLKSAAGEISEFPVALQLRYLQTLSNIAAEKNSTIIFPIPVDMLALINGSKSGGGGDRGGGNGDNKSSSICVNKNSGAKLKKKYHFSIRKRHRDAKLSSSTTGVRHASHKFVATSVVNSASLIDFIGGCHLDKENNCLYDDALKSDTAEEILEKNL